LCHFSGISRTSRHTKMLIQRLLSCFPPAISATEGSPVGGSYAIFAINVNGYMVKEIEPLKSFVRYCF
jgi:hypothetical protein